MQDQAGFKLRNHEFSGSANREGNKRVVYLNPVRMVSDSRQREHAEYAYAVTALDELMHQARKSGFYSDRTLAVAAFGLLTPEEQAKHPLPKSTKEIQNSDYFHPLFNLDCRSITGE